MDFAKIIVKSNKKEAEKIKELLKTLKDHHPNMVISALRYGELGGELLVSFNISTNEHEMVLSKLMLNGMNVWPHDAGTKKLMAKIKESMTQGTASQKGSGWSDLMKKAAESTPEEVRARIDKLVQAGKYEDLIKLSKDFRSKSTADLAKESLPDCVAIAIDKLAGHALQKKYDADKCIKHLLSLGSDPTIASLNKPELLQRAGFAAIDICNNYKDFTWDLIKIIMDNRQHKLVNLRAAAKFNEKVFADPETFNIEIENAVKNLNVRWLQVNFDVVRNQMANEEVNQVTNLINYIRNRRT